MPELTESRISCGVRQLSGLCRNTDIFDHGDSIPPKEIIYSAFQNIALKNITFGMVIFSDSVRRGNGIKLAAYITRYKLGKIIPSDVIRNPNTGRDIQTWIWQLDIPALVTWYSNQATKQKPVAKTRQPEIW